MILCITEMITYVTLNKVQELDPTIVLKKLYTDDVSTDMYADDTTLFDVSTPREAIQANLQKKKDIKM